MKGTTFTKRLLTKCSVIVGIERVENVLWSACVWVQRNETKQNCVYVFANFMWSGIATFFLQNMFNKFANFIAVSFCLSVCAFVCCLLLVLRAT
jgi:hypothetical protein